MPISTDTAYDASQQLSGAVARLSARIHTTAAMRAREFEKRVALRQVAFPLETPEESEDAVNADLDMVSFDADRQAELTDVEARLNIVSAAALTQL